MPLPKTTDVSAIMKEIKGKTKRNMPHDKVLAMALRQAKSMKGKK